MTDHHLYQVKLLAALRSGDPALIHPFLTEIGKDRRSSSDSLGGLDTAAAALHLAVRCASPQTLALLLSHRAISPNGIHPPGSGTTPLHLAASLGRADIVALLLDQDGIDDTIRDAHRRTCRDVAKGKDVVKAIDDSRSFLNASYRSLLRSYILSPLSEPPSPSLLQLLESPRVAFVDLSYLDDASGTSLLHEAARRKDLRLIELAVRAGADVFVRNRRGKMAYESAGKDDKVRVFLRQFANHDRSLIQAPSATLELPALKGYLNKYTNVAKGYNTRWFVLKHGVLSYYRHQEDETITSRGSISMRNALIKVSERTRFEIQSLPSRGHTGVQKWYIKANHPVEASRWIQAIQKSIEWYKQNAQEDSRRPSGESDSSALQSVPSSQSRKNARLSIPGDTESISASFVDPNISDVTSAGMNSGAEQKEDEQDDQQEDDSSSADTSNQQPPHDANFELNGNTIAAQLDLTTQLSADLALPKDGHQTTGEMNTALHDSLSTVQMLFNEYTQMVKDREQWWRKQLQQEKARQSVWEESLATVVREGAALEEELRARSRKRGSRVFGPSVSGSYDAFGSVRSRNATVRAAKAAPPLPLVESPGPQSVLAPVVVLSPPQEVQPAATPAAPAVPVAQAQVNVARVPLGRTSTLDTIMPHGAAPAASIATPTPTTTREITADDGGEDGYDTDEEDEFFDAIESNNLPNLVVPESLTSPSAAVHMSTDLDMEPYAGYRVTRTKLETADERPPTSLWSVLKHSIGKDLTRISFPVFFNEPTSMLQRMAEDMEFSECLDTAATQKDPLKRLAYVAAFAMSNYSSTIGRIAKPFNPMLSETFEYVRMDKKYRYMSEQVSHHPPISACWAESSLWHYYGEVDAQNKFMGKSFEIRPTGVAHADLVIPEAWGPGYPKAPGELGRGKVIEHFTWKKVTTNVSGFILGSPTIDHYGDMVITNHRTGDQCILTFKPRGWRGKDAYEISGQVLDVHGNAVYEIAGRWNSQLIAREVGTGHAGVLHPDTAVSGSTPNSPTTSLRPEYILLWKNSDKPTGSPFNLTPFAITLNDCPKETLKPYLCPTDCRLRPDQRAFELGRYDMANELKMKQEDRQRATRRAREMGTKDAHRPRWFVAETDGDTGERVWTPVRVKVQMEERLEYWVERERVWKAGGREKAQWKDVEEIFIDEPEAI